MRKYISIKREREKKKKKREKKKKKKEKESKYTMGAQVLLGDPIER